MAPLAEVVRPEAKVNCDRAAEHALPIDVLLAMTLTQRHTSSECRQLAVLADKVLLASALLDAKLLLAFDHTAKVGLFALETLVEGALLHGQA